MLTRKMIVGMILAVLVSMGTAAWGATYYVDPNGSDDANGSPEEPFATIQKGIVASSNGDTVIVGDGVYTGYWNRHIQFLGKEVTVRSANGPENCIIDVEWAAGMYGFYIIGGEDSNSVLDGITIIKGSVGIVFGSGSSPLIKNCIIKDCGKGMHCWDSSSPIISGCVISDNAGDGIAWYGTSMTVSRCILSGNSGNGVYFVSASDAVIDNCMIVKNDNGIYLSASDSLTASNCTIAENGYGLRCLNSDTVADVNHCIFWANNVEIYANNSEADITVEYCDVKDGQERVDVPEGTLTWSNNIDADPLFVDTVDGDFHLQYSSPCVDAGDPNYDPNTTDIDGQPRKNRVVDMGADEAGVVWYVDVDATGSETGLSWEDAFTSIQDAIDTASTTHCDLIVVAEGTYSESIDFDGKPVTVKKAKLNEVADAVINPGDTGANVVTLDSGEDAQSVLHGFILTGGKYGVYCGSSSAPRILNCIIKANADSGVYLSGAGAVEIRNDTIIDNSTAGIYVASGGAPSVTNCIVWNNNDDLYGCSATYSCIQDGDSGTGNISSDPLFVNPGGGDYHLDACSPCMDAGNGVGDYEGEEDIYHSPRLQGPYVDMGADEADPNIWTSPGSFNVTLHESGTDTDTLTIGNSGKGDLHFNIWPDNKEALEMYGAGMEEGQGPGYETEFSENEIVLDYEFSEPIVTFDGIYDHLIIEGLDNFEQVGAPIVPMWRVKALVPYGKIVVDIQLRILKEHKLPDTYFLAPAQEPVPVPVSSHNEAQQTEPDPEIYGSNKSWPDKYYKDPMTQSKRGYQLYFVKLFPVQYKPKSGKVSYISKLRLIIKLADKATETILRPTKKLKSALRKKVDNPKALGTYPLKPVGRRDERIIISAEGAGSGFVPGQSYDYIIITSEYLLEATPDPWNFQRLRDSKIARGLTAAIVTTEWIYDEYDGTGEDDQALIRNFLIDVYDWHTGGNNQYALLGGSDEIIPERKFYGYIPFNDREDNIPCDMYYGCVDPCDCNFNYDGDEYYGESTDGVNGGEIDLQAEIYIGRAGVKNMEDVSNFVQKTLIYNATISDYLLRVSMVGQKMDEVSYAKPELEEIRLGGTYSGYFTYGFENHESNDFFDFNTAKNLYEEDYIWQVSELVDIMNNGVHVLNHFAHSGTTSIGKFSVSKLSQLTNEDYYFVYSQGCNAGKFDLGSGQCFAEQVTVKPYGAFAAIMNSRVGWYAPSGTNGTGQKFNRRFWDHVLDYDPNVRALEIGRASQESKEDNFIPPGAAGTIRWCYFTLNMFGDPEQQFLFGQSRDSDWLEAEPASGSAEGEDSTDIDINFDAGMLAPGTYEGDIIIASNDYLNPPVTVPVTMTVLQKPPAVTPYDSFETVRLGEKASFNPESMTYTLTNNGTTSLNWTASSTDNWIDIDPNSGSLDPNEANDVVISFNQNAYDLTKGSYYGNIHFTNTSTGSTHKRVVFLDYTYDYLTEVFDSNELDIENQTLTFYPDGSDSFYTVCRQSASGFPTDPNGGTALTLYSGEYMYDEELIELSDQKQVSLYGEPNDYLYVLGNGIITFETESWKRDALLWDISITSHFFSRSVSGYAAWLAPWDGGDISYKQLEDRIAVTFEDVPEWDEPNNLNSFQVELFFDGRIRVTHLNLDLYWPSEGYPAIVGLSEGNGTPEDFFESDLSEYSSSCLSVHNIDKDIWYMSIQDAIDDANDGDEIEVHEGSYYESIDFGGKAITVRSTDPNDSNVVAATIIDANNVGRAVTFDDGEDANSILTGFTITGGYVSYPEDGAGIYCYGSSPTISSCVIYDNNAGDDGGGISCDNSSSPSISYCLITSNEADDGGGICCNNSSSPTISYCDITYNEADDKAGGIYCKANSNSTIKDCDISLNSANMGGGIYCNASDPDIEDCNVNDNYAGDDAGGIYCYSGSDPTISSCEITDNEAEDKGGGIYCKTNSNPTIKDCQISLNDAHKGGGIYCASSDPQIERCIISNNQTYGGNSADGGGIYCSSSNPNILNCIISDNVSDDDAGGIYCLDGSDPDIINCTLTGNEADDKGGGIYCKTNSDAVITNCILWDDAAPDGPEIRTESSSPVVSYSDVEGGWSGTGNINADPNFMDANDPAGPDGVFGTYDDGLQLQIVSPCIDAADGDVAPSTDITGRGRVDVDYVSNTGTGDPDYADIGAYESPEIWFVDKDATGNDDGSSWEDAFTDLQDAISEANDDYEIWVAEGTYKPDDVNDDRSISFELVEGGGIYGGFAGIEIGRHQRDWTAYTTILSGDIGTPNDLSDNSYHVVKGADEAVLDGFTITRGNANGSSPYNAGGGIYCYDASPTIIKCRIINNKAGVYGGGMFNYYWACPTLINCIFANNSAVGNGVYGGYGGGISNQLMSSTILINCTFCKNSAYIDNSDGGYGGGMFNLLSSPDITNCIFWGNSADSSGDEIDNVTSNPNISYCDIEGCGGSGNWNQDIGTDCGGNIDEDPCFVNADANDFHLDPNSPCIDVGDPNGIYTGQVDIDSDDRVIDIAGKGDGNVDVDIGADEHDPNS